MQFGAPYKIVMQGKVVAYFRGLQAMLDVKARTEERDQRWDELKELADKCDDKAFWKRYAEYLEWDHIISPSRAALHKMASRLATASVLVVGGSLDVEEFYRDE